MLERKEIVVFDFETTGLDSIKDEILEIGAIRLVKENNGFVIKDELEVILKTSMEIPDKITEITGITKQMQEAEGISQDEGFHLLNALIGEDTLLVAYNIQFDLGFLESFYRKFLNPKYEIKNDVLDVMAVYKDRHRYPHRLESAIAKYNINLVNSHRALDDVKATYEVLRVMNDELPNVNKYINVIGFNKKYGVSGKRLNHVKYVAQYGGYREIEKLT